MDREFVEFPKIARLKKDIVITQKLNGTNAAIVITDTNEIYAQSRNKVIDIKSDNMGFANWVNSNAK